MKKYNLKLGYLLLTALFLQQCVNVPGNLAMQSEEKKEEQEIDGIMNKLKIHRVQWNAIRFLSKPQSEDEIWEYFFDPKNVSKILEPVEAELFLKKNHPTTAGVEKILKEYSEKNKQLCSVLQKNLSILKDLGK